MLRIRGADRNQRTDPYCFSLKAFSASGDAHLPPHRQSASSANHTKLESTVRYLGIEIDDALAIAEQVDV
jgi:hypothetical protein